MSLATTNPTENENNENLLEKEQPNVFSRTSGGRFYVKKKFSPLKCKVIKKIKKEKEGGKIGINSAGAVNLSLHSTQWKGSKMVVEKKEKEDKKPEKKDDKDDKKFYKELKDSDEIEKVFGRIKEIKQINSNPNISNEERRNNAEKAVMMLMEMFGFDEEENEQDDDKEKEDEKK